MDFSLNLPHLDVKENQGKSEPLENQMKSKENLLNENLCLDEFSSLSKMLRIKNEKIIQKKNKSENFEEINKNSKPKNNKNNKNNYNLLTENNNNDNNIIHNHININFDSNQRASNAQEELFEKVLDSIKYKKKKKPKKISCENIESNEQRKSLNDNSLTVENSYSASNERNSANLINDFQKFSSDNAKAVLSTRITSERNSDQAMNKLNTQLMKKSFKEILKEEVTENLNNNKFDNKENKENYFTNNKTEANDDRLRFNLLDDFEDDSDNEFAEDKIMFKNDKLINLNIKENKNLDFNENYGEEKITNKYDLYLKNKIIDNNKKNEIQKKIENKKLINANNLGLNINDRKFSNLELSNLNNNYQNLSKICITPYNNNDKLKLSQNKEKLNRNLFQSMNSAQITNYLIKDSNKQNKASTKNSDFLDDSNQNTTNYEQTYDFVKKLDETRIKNFPNKNKKEDNKEKVSIKSEEPTKDLE